MPRSRDWRCRKSPSRRFSPYPLGLKGWTKFSREPAIFDQGLPEYNHDHESCQHKRCKAHLNKRETVIIIAEKTTCNPTAKDRPRAAGPWQTGGLVSVLLRHYLRWLFGFQNLENIDHELL